MASDQVNAVGETAIRAAATRSKARYDEALARVALGLPAEVPVAPASPVPSPTQ